MRKFFRRSGPVYKTSVMVAAAIVCTGGVILSPLPDRLFWVIFAGSVILFADMWIEDRRAQGKGDRKDWWIFFFFVGSILGGWLWGAFISRSLWSMLVYILIAWGMLPFLISKGLARFGKSAASPKT